MKLVSDNQQPSNKIDLDENYSNILEFCNSLKHSFVFFIILLLSQFELIL